MWHRGGGGGDSVSVAQGWGEEEGDSVSVAQGWKEEEVV